MGERERILELVREGILSVDEALDLLESVANKESKNQKSEILFQKIFLRRKQSLWKLKSK